MDSTTSWSREEEKAFENAIATHGPDRDGAAQDWEAIGSMVPTKTLKELKQHYQLLVEDVNAIDSGQVPIPSYVGEEPIPCSLSKSVHGGCGSPTSDRKQGPSFGNGLSSLSREGSGSHGGGKGGSKSEQERKKGIPWTEEEHRLFLLGLDKFGKGDWRSISRNFVISRTPTQVASHAQKYFIRLNSMNRDRRRSSIHDITSVTHQAPVTGQPANTNPAAAKHRAVQPQPTMTGMGFYGAAPLGHPVGHMGSAVGTPVMISPLGHPQPHAPPYVVPMAYPMPPPPGTHQ